VRHPASGTHKSGECQLRVRDDAKLRLIVASDLRRIHVDVDQARGRHPERGPVIPGARVRLGETSTDRDDEIRCHAGLVGDGRAPESGLPHQQWVTIANASLAHERMRDRHLQRFDERCELLARAGGEHSSARVEHRPFGARKRLHNVRSGCGVDGGPSDDGGCLAERADGQLRRKDVHWDIDEHRPRTPRLGEMERALHHPRKILDAVDAIDALAERPVDLELVRILVEVDLLMRVPPLVVRLRIAGKDDHRDGIERRVGDPGGAIRQSGPQVQQQHARLSRRACISIGRVRSHLFVPRGNEPDATLAECVEQRDDRVTAKAEDDLDANLLEIVGELIRGNAGRCHRLGSGTAGNGGSGDRCHQKVVLL
jgi:hypothetical protein